MTSRALLALGTAAALVAAAVPARAAGVGGVELTPREGSSFRITVGDGDRESESFTLRNIRQQPATVRLYGASASDATSSSSVGPAGSADWIDLPTQEITLKGGEEQTRSFSVEGGPEPRTGAIVLEIQQGTIIQRAATLVYLEKPTRIPLPLLLIALAALLAAAIPAALTARRRRGAGLPPPGRDEELEDLEPARPQE